MSIICLYWKSVIWVTIFLILIYYFFLVWGNKIFSLKTHINLLTNYGRQVICTAWKPIMGILSFQSFVCVKNTRLRGKKVIKLTNMYFCFEGLHILTHKGLKKYTLFISLFVGLMTNAFITLIDKSWVKSFKNGIVQFLYKQYFADFCAKNYKAKCNKRKAAQFTFVRKMCR